MSMPNASATAQISTADHHPQHQRPAQCRPAGARAGARRAKPSANVRATRREQRRQPRRQDPLGLEQPRRAAARDVRPCTNITTSVTTATGAITSPPRRIAENSAESRASMPGSNQIRIRRQQQQHGDQVENPLDDDRRERRRGAQALASRQQVGPNHLAGPRRQHGRGCKPDHRGAERDRETRLAPAAPAGTASARSESRNVTQRQATASRQQLGTRRPHRRATRVDRSAFRRKTATRPTARTTAMTVRRRCRKPRHILHAASSEPTGLGSGPQVESGISPPCVSDTGSLRSCLFT